MVEFALAIPLLLLVLLAIVYFGRVFFVSQVLLHAAQEGARIASRTPGLNDAATRDMVRGFSVSGAGINQNSVIFADLASGRLLSQGVSGDLPPGSKVKILPWDADGSASDMVPPGTIAVRIQYPFHLAGGTFDTTDGAAPIAIATSIDGSGGPVPFTNFTISQQATVSQEIYQEEN